jgi:predicted DNA-binding transcriptional regulator AlpA
MRKQRTDPVVPFGDRLISQPVVSQRIGNMSRTTIWRMVRAGLLPAPIVVGNRVFWSEREIAAWIDARLNARRNGGAA